MGTRSKDKSDIYYKLSKENGYRARSVYKLKHIDDSYDIFTNISNIVDLCGAPGSWSQYCQQNKLRNNKLKIVTVDLQDIEPIEDCFILKEDITTQSCVDKILAYFGDEKVDLCLCDGAPDMTGIHDVDEYFQYQLVSKALEISLKISKIGGSFIGKIFRGKYTKYVVSMFKKHYEEVRVLKPKASRHNSIECFIYCKGKYEHQRDCFPVEDFEVIGCGDGPDSDMTRNLVEKMTLKPLTQPINPPYKDSIDKRRAN